MIPLVFTPKHAIGPGMEQQFKSDFIENYPHNGVTIFEIENEEKVPGFTDTIEVRRHYGTTFVEYKATDRDGFFKFEKSQPRFYKQNENLRIYVRVWSTLDGKAYEISANEVLTVIKTKKAMANANPLRMRIIGGTLS